MVYFFYIWKWKLALQKTNKIPSRKLTYPTLGKGKSSSKVPAGRGYVNSQEGRLFPILFGSSTYKIKRKKGIPESSVLVSKRAWKFPDENPGEWLRMFTYSFTIKNKQMLVNTPFASIRHGIHHLTTSWIVKSILFLQQSWFSGKWSCWRLNLSNWPVEIMVSPHFAINKSGELQEIIIIQKLQISFPYT